MSDLVFPSFPNVRRIEAPRERQYRTRIFESPDGSAEQRVSWRATPRRRFRVVCPVLRDNVAAPAPWNPYSELDALHFFHDQHRGAGDSFLFDDPDARKNLVAYSQDFSQAAWSAVHLTKTAGANAPDGTATAMWLAEDTAAAVEHFIEEPSVLDLANGETAVISIHASPGVRHWLQVSWVQRDGTTVIGAWFDISAGVVGTLSGGVTAAISPVGSGWYKCAASGSAGSGASQARPRFKMGQSDNQATYTGDGASGFYIWGAQVERATSAGLYVPTGASPATGRYRVRFEDDMLAPEKIGAHLYRASFELVMVSA